MKRIVSALVLCFLAPILLATSCDEDREFNYPIGKIDFVETQNLHVSDTVWVNYWVSSRIFDMRRNDSIANSQRPETYFNLLKMHAEQNGRNASVYTNWQPIMAFGFSDANECSGHYISEISSSEKLYRMRVGFKATEAGDYAIPIEHLWQFRMPTEMDFTPLNDYPLASGFDLSYEHPCSGTRNLEVNSEYGSVLCFHVSP